MFPISDSVKAKRFPFITISLILITCYVFYLQLTTPGSLIETYALTPSTIDVRNTTTLQPFITSMFLHGGFMHIISNMWFLKVFGDNVEGEVGHIPYFLLYILSGLAGSLVQYLFTPYSTIPMLGASGAVAGALGAYIILFPHHKVKTFLPIFFPLFTIFEVPAVIMLGYWFILQIFSGVGSIGTSADTGGVAFWAHVAGFITGLILGKLFSFKNRPKRIEGDYQELYANS